MCPRLITAVAMVALAACTCDPLGFEKNRFSCSTNADCTTGYTCLAGECRASAPQDSGAGGGAGGGIIEGMGGGAGGGGMGGGSSGGGMGGGATGGGMAGGAMGGGMGGGAMGGGMGGGATGGGLGGGTGGGMDAGPVYDIPNGVELLRESFDDSNFPTRGWYGVGAATIVAQTAPDGGAGAFQCAFISGATACTNGTPGRHLFTATETLYIRSWVRFGPGWSGSGSNTTFPVVFNVLTDADSMYIGPGSTVLTIEANIVANRVQLGVHDGANVNPACVLWDDGGFSGCGGNPSTYVFTESRSVAACNGFVGALHLHHCELFGTEYFSGRSWMPPTPWFTDAAGPRYESDWHLFESYFQMNTVQAGIGVPDGKLRAWLDGQRVLTVDQVLFRTGARPNIKFNQFLVVGYIGNGSPAAQEYYLDELVVGTGLLP